MSAPSGDQPEFSKGGVSSGLTKNSLLKELLKKKVMNVAFSGRPVWFSINEPKTVYLKYVARVTCDVL